MSRKTDYSDPRKHGPQTYDPARVQDFFDNYYKDRGVVKWQGFFLSDHTAALKKQAADEGTVIEQAPQQSIDKIKSIISDVQKAGKGVRLQLADLDPDGNIIEVEGHLETADEERFTIRQDRFQPATFEYEKLRHVWYN